MRDDAPRFLGEHSGEAELGRAAALQRLARSAQQVLAGLVDDAQPQRHVERENRDVDVGDDLLQQRAGLERLEPLVVKRAAQRVDLDHDFAERVVGVDIAAAHRVVAFAQRFQHVCERLQRPNDMAAHGHETDQNAQRQKTENRVTQSLRGARKRQQHHRRDPRGRDRQHRDEEHPVLKTQALAARHKPNFSIRR